VYQPVDNGDNAGRVREHLAPFGKRAVGGHEGRLELVPAVDDVEQQIKLDEVAPDQDGQICSAIYPTKPLGLLTAYEDANLNKGIFKGGWYLTGDTAYQDKDGYIHFVGRVDDVFKSQLTLQFSNGFQWVGEAFPLHE